MNPSGPLFTVQGVGRFPEHLERLIQLSRERGLHPVFLEVVREMIVNLRTRPREWGDPYTNFRGLNAVRYVKPIIPIGLRIEYAVHNTEPLVWVSTMLPLPGSPLG